MALDELLHVCQRAHRVAIYGVRTRAGEPLAKGSLAKVDGALYVLPYFSKRRLSTVCNLIRFSCHTYQSSEEVVATVAPRAACMLPLSPGNALLLVGARVHIYTAF